MTNDQSSRGAENTSTDRVGKVFVALGQGMRKCLICDGVFLRQGASAHANVVCVPQGEGIRCRSSRN